jgi:hypothetical protein
VFSIFAAALHIWNPVLHLKTHHAVVAEHTMVKRYLKKEIPRNHFRAGLSKSIPKLEHRTKQYITLLK